MTRITHPSNKAPNMLLLTSDGRLYCRDGGSVKGYLREYAEKLNLKEAIPVAITTRETMQQFIDDSWLLHNLGA